jgi:hypothetical protein
MRAKSKRTSARSKRTSARRRQRMDQGVATSSRIPYAELFKRWEGETQGLRSRLTTELEEAEKTKEEARVRATELRSMLEHLGRLELTREQIVLQSGLANNVYANQAQGGMLQSR